MARYFTLQELLHSDTARREGIENLPAFAVVRHLETLSEVLDLIRIAWGSAIIVTSGYRCEELNKKVGGVKNSAHLTGWGVDLQPKNGKQDLFDNFVANFLVSSSIGFDQLIREKSGATKWLHLALYNNNNEQRGLIFNSTK